MCVAKKISGDSGSAENELAEKCQKPRKKPSGSKQVREQRAVKSLLDELLEIAMGRRSFDGETGEVTVGVNDRIKALELLTKLNKLCPKQEGEIKPAIIIDDI